MDVETAHQVVAAIIGTMVLVVGVDFGIAFLMRASSEAAARD